MREPTTCFDADRAESIAESRRAQADRRVETHEHVMVRNGRILQCWCGEVVDEWDAS